MTIDRRRWAVLASLLLALAVVFGAFGAHALQQSLSPKQLATFATANRYHFYASLGLLLLAILPSGFCSEACVRQCCRILFIGMLLFCVSLYALSCMRVPYLGIITPFGGLCLIFAWTRLAWGIWRYPVDA